MDVTRNAKRTFLAATRRSSDWMNMYFSPPTCTPPAWRAEGSSIPATIFCTSSGDTCERGTRGGERSRVRSGFPTNKSNIQRSRGSGRAETHVEAGGGGPERAVDAADSTLGHVTGADQVVVDVGLPAHGVGGRRAR